MDNNKLIRVDDIKSPRYTKQQLEAIKFGDHLKIDLSVDSVLESAAKRLKKDGLDDIGPDDLIERLSVQIDSVKEDDNISPLGAMGVFNEWVLYAENRSRLYNFD